MKRFRIALTATTLALSASLFGTIDSAQAAACNFTPKQATLYSKSKNVTFDVPDSNDWSISVDDLYIYAYQRPDYDGRVESLSPSSYDNADAGLHDAVVEKDDHTYSCTFRLMRGSSIAINVYRHGNGREVYGRLFRADFDSYEHNYVPYKGQAVTLQFQSAVSGRWVTAGTVATQKDGEFWLDKKIGKRNWRAVFNGTSTTGARTSVTAVG